MHMTWTGTELGLVWHHAFHNDVYNLMGWCD